MTEWFVAFVNENQLVGKCAPAPIHLPGKSHELSHKWTSCEEPLPNFLLLLFPYIVSFSLFSIVLYICEQILPSNAILVTDTANIWSTYDDQPVKPNSLVLWSFCPFVTHRNILHFLYLAKVYDSLAFLLAKSAK
jgi:hypothetical protein